MCMYIYPHTHTERYVYISESRMCVCVCVYLRLLLLCLLEYISLNEELLRGYKNFTTQILDNNSMFSLGKTTGNSKQLMLFMYNCWVKKTLRGEN